MAANAKSAKQRQTQTKQSQTDLRKQKRKREVQDVDQLNAAVQELDLKTNFQNFLDLPLSDPTKSGLKATHFQVPTDVQAQAIPLALKGRDILGAARTGSGKTLAFLIPVLEKLYRSRWTELDGLGALILSPTRELAVQIFEVLRKIGRYHAFSAGLVIGGKNMKEEAERLVRMNILVCTPGRMLQHLDQTAGFDADNLQILVLDEADRIMDMGFQTAVDALVEHLPKTRQTLMFSATQSKKVSDLARLSLKEPDYVSVHEAATTATPSNLQQHYIVTPLPDKLDTLYGFIKANLKSKILVFLSSGKQVRFVYESFRHMRPGVPLLHLHGRQKQVARLGITDRFSSAKQACLFATDVVARGIDFPAVDWVIQADCPEDVDTYIHRVGRTARYQSNGRAVLFLDPSEEEGMIKKLEHKKIPVAKVHVKEKKKRNTKDQLQSMCFQYPDLKYLGQKAFISYAKAIHLQKDKEIFDLKKIDLDGFAESLGLPGTPQIKFQKGQDVKRIKNAPRDGMSSGSESEMDLDGPKKPKKKEIRTKYDKMFERTNQDVLSSHYSKMVVDGDDPKAAAALEGDSDSDADFLSVKRRLNDSDLDAESSKAGHPLSTKILTNLGGEQPFVVDSKRREKALTSKKKMLKFRGNPSKVVFDDEGNAHELYELQDEEDFKQEGDAGALRQKFLESEMERVREADVDDKAVAKQKKRDKREKRKAAEASEREEEFDGPRLKSVDGDSDGDNDDGEQDPLEFLRSLPIAGEYRDDDDKSEAESEEDRPRKKAKKWFQDDDDANPSEKTRDRLGEKKDKKNKKNRTKVFEQEEPETLADLEALAAGLLDG